VRFAPSPTGMLHLGSARTALFNWLFARHHGGVAVLRIEDTDRARSSREFEAAQIRDLDWLGLRFDEGPVRQSERGELYVAAARRLLEEGKAYRRSGLAVYLRPGTREGFFRDRLRGEVGFSGVEDFVLMKSDGTPTYNFAAVVDDLEMGITHVIRGEEHLSNTARQVLVYRALGGKPPEFIHLGVILGPDGRKLSKRHGARSVAEYRREGYLPEAIVSYLALLGWSHPEGREEFGSLEELAREWDPARLGASPAVFDPDRLRWTNARRIRALSAEELWERMEPFVRGVEVPGGRETFVAEAVQSELATLADAPVLVEKILEPVDPAVFARDLPERAAEVYAHAASVLAERAVDSVESARGLVGELRAWAEERGIRARELLHPLRLALTGRDRGPEMAYLLAALGPEEAKRRLEAAREAIGRR
jgi:glutamyl-tRNA synthetase